MYILNNQQKFTKNMKDLSYIILVSLLSSLSFQY